MEMWNLEGQVALVTGASRGVGQGIAHALGRSRAIVYITGRSQKIGQHPDGLAGTISETAAQVNEADVPAAPGADC